MRQARSEKQSRRFTENSAHRKNTACDNTVHTSGKYDGSDDSPFACTESECTLTIALRHGFQTFLCGAHNRWQIHDYKGESAGEQ